MPEIQKVHYTHDAMIDLIIANPAISQNEIAAIFGYTPAWVSIIFNSEAFRERLEERKAELVDPAIVASIETKLRALVDTSTQVVLERLSVTRDPKLALRALEVTTRALGYGASKAAANAAVNVNFSPVVVVPAQESDSETWRAKFAPTAPLPQLEAA